MTYIYIRSDKNSLCTWWSQYRNLFKVPPTSLETFIEKPNCVLVDRVQYTRITVHIPNVFLDEFKIFSRVFRTVIIKCTKLLNTLCTYIYAEEILNIEIICCLINATEPSPLQEASVQSASRKLQCTLQTQYFLVTLNYLMTSSTKLQILVL
jgi:hypothetical protein